MNILINFIFSFMNRELVVKLQSHKFFIFYIVFAFIGLLFEFILRNFLLLTTDINNVNFISFFFGLNLIFYLNIKYNFKIRNFFLIKSLIFFLSISFISFFLQTYILSNFSSRNLVVKYLFNYELLRLVISTFFFIIFYYFHYNISFKRRKKIGIAVYTNYKKKTIIDIHDAIDEIPDFIHIDLGDKTFNKNSNSNKLKTIKYIKSMWPKKKIDLHIMSKKPSLYLKDLKYGDVDKIYFHSNVKEDIDDVIENSKKICNDVGLALFYDTNIKQLRNVLKKFDEYLVLCIKKPGISGAMFENKSFKKIKELQKLYQNSKICVDGGINKKIADRLDCEFIVSSSFVIKSSDPKERVYKLRHELLV